MSTHRCPEFGHMDLRYAAPVGWSLMMYQGTAALRWITSAKKSQYFLAIARQVYLEAANAAPSAERSAGA
jgi:hypothetical protein